MNETIYKLEDRRFRVAGEKGRRTCGQGVLVLVEIMVPNTNVLHIRQSELPLLGFQKDERSMAE